LQPRRARIRLLLTAVDAVAPPRLRARRTPRAFGSPPPAGPPGACTRGGGRDAAARVRQSIGVVLRLLLCGVALLHRRVAVGNGEPGDGGSPRARLRVVRGEEPLGRSFSRGARAPQA